MQDRTLAYAKWLEKKIKDLNEHFNKVKEVPIFKDQRSVALQVAYGKYNNNKYPVMLYSQFCVVSPEDFHKIYIDRVWNKLHDLTKELADLTDENCPLEIPKNDEPGKEMEW